MVFAFLKEDSPFIQIVHSVRKFGGEPFNPAGYHHQVIGFIWDHVQGVNPVAILVKGDAWKWTKGSVVLHMVNLWTFYSGNDKR